MSSRGKEMHFNGSTPKLWTLTLLLRMVLLLAAVPEQAVGDYWGEWSAWSECSRTCDGGATYQERKCIRSFHSRQGCEGDRYRYDTCNTQACPPDGMDFRSEQCTAYNNATYGGMLYDWLPYTDRKNPCALYCIPKGTRTVVRLAPKVLDGTRCKHNAFDMCISGKCWKVGCDYKLGSDVHLDLCGVCGGNNSCLTGTQSLKERYQWREAGLSQCSASCGVGVQVSVFVCYEALSEQQVGDSHCPKSEQPAGRRQNCFRRRCPPVWKIFPWQPCTVTCGGGTKSRAVRCMDTLMDGRQQWLHDSFCPSPRPSMVQACSKQICPTWYAGQWSPCSVTCGWGAQVREVVCRHEGDTFCEHDSKPITRRNCTTTFACNDPDDPRYIAERDETDSRQEITGRELRDGAVTFVHEEDVNNHDMRKPRYVVSSFSACSVTCGKGTRQRWVTCQVHLVYLRDFVNLADSECPDEKPATMEVCEKEPCYSDYEWRATGVTACDRSCLGGIQETLVQCLHKTNNTEAPDDHCLHSKTVPVERKICNDIPCPQRWRIGDFSPCSTTCGGGLMIREVTCIQEVSSVMDKVLTLPDFMCQKPVPQRVRTCNTQFCPADWATGFWSECSATCGPGVQLRPVVCQRVTADGTPTDVDEYHCPPTEKPVSELACNESPCPIVRIKRQTLRFFQLNKMERVRLKVGTTAAILPGTSVIATCPVRGASTSKTSVEWLRNDRPLRKTRRMHVSSSGKLRITNARPDRDTANYTCIAGTERARLELTFSDFYALLQETALREKYLLGFLADSPSENTSVYHKDPSESKVVYHKDPYDRQQRPLQVVVGDWSPCSATCDGGLRTRAVSCEIITKDYYEAFPESVCRKGGLSLPEKSLNCALQPCVKWTVGEWSPCAVENCVSDGQSVLNRTVRCTAERNASYVSDDLCDVTMKPVVTQKCFNSLCHPVWNTSQWSECSADCGEEGVQMRMLACIWEQTGLPAGRSCQGLARPQPTRNCRGPECKKSCKDHSDYCNVVKVMNMCEYSNFKQKCCKSCRKRLRRNS